MSMKAARETAFTALIIVLLAFAVVGLVTTVASWFKTEAQGSTSEVVTEMSLGKVTDTSNTLYNIEYIVDTVFEVCIAILSHPDDSRYFSAVGVTCHMVHSGDFYPVNKDYRTISRTKFNNRRK